MKNKNILDYIILLRPTLFPPFWLTYLIGTYYSNSKFGLKSLIGIVIFTFMMGGVYIMNQLIDMESDKINKKLFLLSENYIGKKEAIYYMLILFFISLPFSFFINKNFGFFFLLAFLIGILYSGYPFSFKDRPFLDMLSNGLGYGTLSFLLGWSVNKDISLEAYIKTIPYFLAVSAVFLNSTIPDMIGDKISGKITTGVFLGKKKTLFLAFILDILSVISSFFLKDKICLFASLLSLPLFFIVFIKPTKKFILYSIRVNPLFLTIGVIFIYPLFIIPLLIVYLFQKIYYKIRFNINYPSIESGLNANF